ncbi:peptide ABC transporter substrate-binding protein [Clostridium luticellarii]|uniref:Oligopeptide-binding protein OppA n=1 Tax=Clostridium luticellarii TaxID=1691940 RepID=A0A2T0BSN7_9CLOT|nr:peptide ABC transporter substrate-binding protein [Clostridium luticellarii]MCI1945606.1 peptide ABC transporter substrate-binding protein [Clostridium luticellarii]MCI1969392.1 peptide ABC transporter substrate-binding protein [Clostridium luticellarii]MCI1996452.1 peptide ABC transporter substrate-binding protein [Clostridium luticellarii]MCI2040805.1 peptide ABC transporter substrate-binding protein [Clostridium luticellarii]PRR86908.1 Oligopeptide-binding protein OppA precursor [Clostri
MKKLICIISIMLMISIVSITLIGGSLEKKVEETGNNEHKNSLVYNLGESPKSLLMLDSDNVRQKDILANTFEGLVSSDENGNIIPGLAESWSVDEGKTCYTFKIRENARWSNGSSITAYDFVSFFSDILNKDMDNIYAAQLNCIFGVEKYRQGKSDFKDVAINALDSKTLRIRLNYPSGCFLNILAQPIYSLRNIDYKLVDWKKEYKSILYSGSFVIDNISQNGDITLKKNSDYWNKSQVKSSSIILSGLKTNESALAAFQDDRVNIFVDPPLGEIKNIKNKVNYITVPKLEGKAIAFNMKKQNIVSNVQFRNFVSMVVDRKEIVENILIGTAQSANSYIPDYVSDGLNGKFINREFFQSASQSENASDMIKSLNYSKDESLTLIYVDSVENKKVCENIAQHIKNKSGIIVNCRGYELSKFKEQLKKGSYDMAEVDYRGDYDYPLAFLNMWKSSSSYDLYGYKNLQIDNKLMQAEFEEDGNQKIEIVRDIENTLAQDMPAVPLYFNDTVIISKIYVKGVYANKMGNVKLDRVYFAH